MNKVTFKNSVRAGIVGLTASAALWGYMVYTSAEQVDRCVVAGMDYMLSEEEEAVRENYALRQTYLTGELPAPKRGVAQGDLLEAALNGGRAARETVKNQCQLNPTQYHF